MASNNDATRAGANGDARPLIEIPAIAELIGLGQRFVLWKEVKDRKGKIRKVPIRAHNGKAASSTDPATWASWEACGKARRRHRAAGPGVTFNGDGLGGVDLDGCRNPETGEISPWAQELIADFASYAEVSPSGTGVKIFARGAPASLAPNKISIGTEPAFGGEHPPQIEAYTTARYFTITGQHLDGTPDEIVEAPEAWERLAYRLRTEGGGGAEAGARTPPPPPDGTEAGALPEPLVELLASDAKLKAAWASGEKLTRGKDHSRSGKDFSLAVYLAERRHDEGLIELALRHYPHGQIGGGELNGTNAERRLGRLIKEAAKVRAQAVERAKAEQDAPAWKASLVTSRSTGTARDCLANGAIILRQDPVFQGRIRFDEFRQATICRDMPWRPGGEWREWADIDDLRFAEWCQLRDVPLTVPSCAGAVQAVADDNRTHPVREWLDGLTWDGTPRLDSWLTRYCRAPLPEGDSNEAKLRRAYVREIGRCWMISAVARIYQPGCQADHVLVLEGRQGLKKSTTCEALGVDPAWFTDCIADLGTKDSAQDLRGKWIAEIGELDAMSRSDVNRVKAFTSRRVDHYRPSYGRRSQDFPRQCVFIASTNRDTYLPDETGNRRWWGTRVGPIDLDGLRAVIPQLWAEAVAAYRAGARWWLTADIERVARLEQEARRIPDPWDDDVMDWAERQAEPVTLQAALSAMGVPQERRDQAASNRIARIFKAHGWERYRLPSRQGRGYGYRPTDLSQLSQSGEGETGTEKASNSAACPSVPVVPVDSSPSERPPPPPPPPPLTPRDPRPPLDGGGGGGGGVPSKLCGPPGSDWDTGTTGTAEAGAPLTPAWDDLDAWRQELRGARGRDQRRDVALRWARAAGGTVSNGGAAAVTLPPGLPRGLALVELQRLVKECGLRASPDWDNRDSRREPHPPHPDDDDGGQDFEAMGRNR